MKNLELKPLNREELSGIVGGGIWDWLFGEDEEENTSSSTSGDPHVTEGDSGKWEFD